MKNYMSLVLGAVLAGGVSVASAADPLALTDDQMDGVTAGIGQFILIEVQKFVAIDTFVNRQKLADYQVNVQVVGYSADAEAAADAQGPNADAETLTNAQIEELIFVDPGTGALVTTYKANAYSQSVALVSR